jgi:hypothetical protein
MAYFAKVLDGIVVDVHTVATAVITDPGGQQVEALGQAFLSDLWGGDPAEYVRTHYPVDQPTPYPRGCFAGVGYSWDGTVFAPPIVPDPIPPVAP